MASHWLRGETNWFYSWSDSRNDAFWEAIKTLVYDNLQSKHKPWLPHFIIFIFPIAYFAGL